MESALATSSYDRRSLQSLSHHLTPPQVCTRSAPILNTFANYPSRPTVCPSVASRNLLLYQSLPISIPYRQDNVRRRKDAHRVGTAARGIVEGLHRFSRRVRIHC